MITLKKLKKCIRSKKKEPERNKDKKEEKKNEKKRKQISKKLFQEQFVSLLMVATKCISVKTSH